MLRFAANIGPDRLFSEHPFLARFARARAAGFPAVEFPQPYDYAIDDIRHASDEAAIRIVQFNLPNGGMPVAGRGFANDPARVEEFRAGVSLGLDTARELDVRLMICPIGLALPDVPLAEQWATVKENVRQAAGAAQRAGIRLLVEPINPYDFPGYLLTRMDQAAALVSTVGAGTLGIVCDLYHTQRTEGNLVELLRTYREQVVHVEFADSPTRTAPGTGEINFSFVFRELGRMRFAGWVCPEYDPRGQTGTTLDWFDELRRAGLTK